MAERDPKKGTERVLEERSGFSPSADARVAKQIGVARRLIERDRDILAALAK
jgi:hypothetical protein